MKTTGRNVLNRYEYVKVRSARKPSKAGSQYVQCRNSRYSFELSRPRPDSPWFVKSLDDQKAIDRVTSNHGSYWTNYPILVFDELLPEWFTKPGFVVKSVKSDARSEEPLAAIEFEYAKPEKSASPYWIHDGTLWLNPDRMWTIDRFAVNLLHVTGSEQTMSTKIEYSPSVQSMPAVERITVLAAGREGKSERTFDFTRWENRAVPESEFTLTAFGLPEITPPSAWTTGRLWPAICAAGLILMVIGIFVRRRYGRA